MQSERGRGGGTGDVAAEPRDCERASNIGAGKKDAQGEVARSERVYWKKDDEEEADEVDGKADEDVFYTLAGAVGEIGYTPEGEGATEEGRDGKEVGGEGWVAHTLGVLVVGIK